MKKLIPIIIMICLLPNLVFGNEKFTLKIGYVAIVSHLPFIVSYDDLRLRKIDFKIECNQYLSFTSLEAGFRTGLVDIAAIPVPIAFSIITDEYQCKECKIKIIGSLHKGGSTIVGRSGYELNSLKGSIIGTPGLDSTETLIFKELMTEKKLQLGFDYEVIGDSFGNVLQNFESKKIDVIFFPEPYGTLAIDQKKAVPFQGANPVVNDTHYTVLVVKTELIDKHPNVVKTWLQSAIKACRTIEKDIEETNGLQTAILQSSYFGFPKDIMSHILKNRVGGIKFDGFILMPSELKKLYNEASNLKLVMKSINWNDIIYSDLMHQLLQK